MRNPDIYTATQLRNWDADVQIDKKWVPARPEPFCGLKIFKSIKLAVGVLIGKYDVIEWYKQ